MALEGPAGTDFDASSNGLVYRSGEGNQTSGSNPPGKLWLPIWAGEVINAYDEFNMFEPLVTKRTISSGTTMEHPSWNAGEELIGGEDSTATTFTVTLDKRPTAAHFELDNVDLMLTQWEYRSELARQAAMTLANNRDKQLFSYICRAALSNPFSNDPRSDISIAKLDTMMYGNAVDNTQLLDKLGDATATSADRQTAALSALEAIEKYIVDLQELNVPFSSLYMAVTPQAFMDIRALGVARTAADLGIGSATSSRPYFGGVAEEGGLGAPYSQGLGNIHDTLEYMGCTIIKSNHVLQTDLGSTDLGEAKYSMNFATGQLKGAIWVPECVAALNLQGLKVDSVADVRRNTNFTVASMMSGTGVLRPECAAIITGLELGSGSEDGVLQDRSDVAGNKFSMPSE